MKLDEAILAILEDAADRGVTGRELARMINRDKTQLIRAVAKLPTKQWWVEVKDRNHYAAQEGCYWLTKHAPDEPVDRRPLPAAFVKSHQYAIPKRKKTLPKLSKSRLLRKNK